MQVFGIAEAWSVSFAYYAQPLQERKHGASESGGNESFTGGISTEEDSGDMKVTAISYNAFGRCRPLDGWQDILLHAIDPKRKQI